MSKRSCAIIAIAGLMVVGLLCLLPQILLPRIGSADLVGSWQARHCEQVAPDRRCVEVLELDASGYYSYTAYTQSGEVVQKRSRQKWHLEPFNYYAATVYLEGLRLPEWLVRDDPTREGYCIHGLADERSLPCMDSLLSAYRGFPIPGELTLGYGIVNANRDPDAPPYEVIFHRAP